MHLLKFRKLRRDPAAAHCSCNRQNTCQIANQINRQLFTRLVGGEVLNVIEN